LDYLAIADFESQSRLWHFLLQHESQHCETIALVLAALGQHPVYPASAAAHQTPAVPTAMIAIPAGGFWQGSNAATALDNERPAHWLELPEYWIDPTPVTCGQYQEFMAAGGYHDRAWWSESGWTWQQTAQITQPHYWRPELTASNHPVCGVSWYEADAYARFRGKRLPTEAEWEKAAQWHDQTSQDCGAHPSSRANLSHHDRPTLLSGTSAVTAFPSGRSPTGLWDSIGNVWEWTDSWFAPYPGFTPFPYGGYSASYFDQAHRVLRGGSWATRPWSIRPSFRNWYHPWSRVIFAGFRCAQDPPPR
jgi:ergothioneine biosynthesis protein EgtB